MKKLVSQAIVDYLEYREVEHVFGLCGHTVIAMLDVLENSSLNFVSVRHEQVASHAADGYARTSGKTGVVLVHLGPGLTNATTGVANAALDSIPMVVIAGDVPSYYYGKHPHQEINMHSDGSQYDIYKPFVKRAWRLESPELLPDILDKAFTLAESGRPGPVLISVPMNIFSEEIDTDLLQRTRNHRLNIAKPALDSQVSEQIISQLLKAENPLIHIGGGVLSARASSELEEFVDFLNIPVTRTLMGQGGLSDRHPLMAGMTGFWGTEFTNSLAKNADVVLALGTCFKEADSSSWYRGVTFNFPPSRLIHIDIDPSELGRNYPVEIAAIADIKIALKNLLDTARKMAPQGVQRSEVIERIRIYKDNFKAANRAIENDARFPMTPQRILKDVREVLPEDGIIFTDVGWNKNGVGQQFDITVPGTIHHPSGLATMGFGSAAVLGAKLGAPDKKVITLVGDGGFGTNPSVIATAVEQNIACIWVVMNNSAFGTIAGLENEHYNTQFGTLFTTASGEPYSPNWADIAQGYGIKAKKVTAAEKFAPILQEALDSNEPYLIEAPMENIPVPTDGVWNINDIYTPKQYVKDGILVDEGQYAQAVRKQK